MTRRAPKLLRHLVALMTLPLLLAAPAAAQEPPTFEVVLENGVVTPRELVLPAAPLVLLRVINKGVRPAEFESNALRIERIIAPGATVVLRLRNPAPGEYPFEDEFAARLDTAHGVIIVRPPAETAPPATD